MYRSHWWFLSYVHCLLIRSKGYDGWTQEDLLSQQRAGDRKASFWFIYVGCTHSATPTFCSWNLFLEILSFLRFMYVCNWHCGTVQPVFRDHYCQRSFCLLERPELNFWCEDLECSTQVKLKLPSGTTCLFLAHKGGVFQDMFYSGCFTSSVLFHGFTWNGENTSRNCLSISYVWVQKKKKYSALFQALVSNDHNLRFAFLL